MTTKRTPLNYVSPWRAEFRECGWASRWHVCRLLPNGKFEYLPNKHYPGQNIAADYTVEQDAHDAAAAANSPTPGTR